MAIDWDEIIDKACAPLSDEVRLQRERAERAEAALRQERERRELANLAYQDEVTALKAAEQRITTLEATLREYGGHRWDCPSASYRDRGGELQPGDGPCRCGLDAALAAQPAQGRLEAEVEAEDVEPVEDAS